MAFPYLITKEYDQIMLLVVHVRLPWDILAPNLYLLKFDPTSHMLVFVNYLLMYIVFKIALILLNLSCLSQR
jgi:hypothetical protein